MTAADPVTVSGHCCTCASTCQHDDGPWLCLRHATQPVPLPGLPATGWTCPACGTSCAPHVRTCPHCAGHAWTSARIQLAPDAAGRSYEEYAAVRRARLSTQALVHRDVLATHHASPRASQHADTRD